MFPSPGVGMTEQMLNAALSVEDFHATAGHILREVGKVIVAQHAVVRRVLICGIPGARARSEGVPGRGKTILLRPLADAFPLKFPRIHFPPDAIPADVTGTNI